MRLVDTWAIVRHSTDRPVKGGQMGVAHRLLEGPQESEGEEVIQVASREVDKRSGFPLKTLGHRTWSGQTSLNLRLHRSRILRHHSLRVL